MDIKGLKVEKEPIMWKGQNDQGRGNNTYIGCEVEAGAALREQKELQCNWYGLSEENGRDEVGDAGRQWTVWAFLWAMTRSLILF